MGKKIIIKEADFSANGILNPSYDIVMDYTAITASHRPLVSWGQDNLGLPTVFTVSGKTIRYIMIYNYVSIETGYDLADEVRLYKFNKDTGTGTYIGSYTPSEGTAESLPIVVDLGANVTFASNEILVFAGFVGGVLANTEELKCSVGVGIYNAHDSQSICALLRNASISGTTLSGRIEFVEAFTGHYPDIMAGVK